MREGVLLSVCLRQSISMHTNDMCCMSTMVKDMSKMS